MYGTKIRTDADDSSMEGVYKDGKCREKEMGLQPVFCIFNLAQPLMIEGMDKKPMQLQRMLLMLAPMPIDETIGKILGKISGAIIMNDLNTEIFHSGNEAIVYQLLSSLLIEEMKG